MFRPPNPRLIEEFDERGFVIIRAAIDPGQRLAVRRACEVILASDETRGRDRGADGKDGFRGCVNLDTAFLPLVANPRVLPMLAALLSSNIHLLSTQLISLPSLPPGSRRTIRTPDRPGWHRDMYAVAHDLGHHNVPRMAIKCAYYLTDLAPACGITMFLPGSHLLPDRPAIPDGAADPPSAVTPDVGPCDAVVFENRTWHAGGINMSGKPRLAVMTQYGYRWLARVDDPPAELLARSGLSPIERQMLGAPDRAADGSFAKGAGAAPLREALASLTSAPQIADEPEITSTGPGYSENHRDIRQPGNTLKEPVR